MLRLFEALLCIHFKKKASQPCDAAPKGYPNAAVTKCPTSSSASTLLACTTPSTSSRKEKEADQVAADAVLTALLTATDKDDLERQLGSMVRIENWRESLAERVLHGLEEALKQSEKLGTHLKKAYDVVMEAKSKFEEEHPVYAAVIETVVVIGVMYLTMGWVLEILGFAARGIRLGSWAARWQSQIGNVEAGSLFSWLQKVAAKWKMLGKVSLEVHTS
jgi:hypothetical protein